MFAELSDHAKSLHAALKSFMAEEVYPNEKALLTHAEAAERWAPRPLLGQLQAKAKARGLWNLFYHGPGGQGLSNFEYAHLCETLGRSLAAPEIFNCNAPDVGNMELLLAYGTAEQKERWLKPLLGGDIRSCFAMTEPRVASSDATNIETAITRDGDQYVINGRKWWITGAMSPRCKVAIVMGKSDPSAPKHKQQSMILVPMDTPGLRIERPLSVYGYEHPPLGHAELIFDHVRVPATNMLLGEGRGFEIAQGRLGPGRIHHAMRLIGVAERALERMCRRVKSRVAFGRPLAEQSVTLERIAESRIRIDQARLLVYKAAWLMDTVGNKAARAEIAGIKIAAAETACQVLDWAIQAHGAAGICDDFQLARAYAHARSIRIADGPDEVHRNQIGRLELDKYA